MNKIALGLEGLLSEKTSLLRGARVGLICNPTTVDHNFRHAADLFCDHPNINLTALFGPQHGIRGETQDNMIEWEGFRDNRTGVKAYSLYGQVRKPTEEMLQDVDALVFDVQDVGTRVYTFIYTMALAMQAAREFGKRFIALDRPNPIGGRAIEGNILELGHESFVGMFPIPMRHGMTVAELARMFNEEFK
ncbi:MAG: exo-beta-N-acetylmuramidase NamZ family protein, partial [Blastocatellia bacterium]